MKIALHAITISVIQIGIYCWWQRCEFGNEVWVSQHEQWVTAYYIWDKLVMFLLVICCISPVKLLHPFWCIVGMFFVVRLCLEFWAIFEDVGKWLTHLHVMFLINLLCTAIVMIKCRKLKE